jgi:hypothetical protein
VPTAFLFGCCFLLPPACSSTHTLIAFAVRRLYHGLCACPIPYPFYPHLPAAARTLCALIAFAAFLRYHALCARLCAPLPPF